MQIIKNRQDWEIELERMSHRLGKKVLTIKERMLRIWKEYFEEFMNEKDERDKAG